MTRRNVEGVFREWQKNPEFVAAYEALAEEFALADALIAARAGAKLSQAELARRIGSDQASVSKYEGGKLLPSTRTLKKIADATGTMLVIGFEKKASAGPAREARRGAAAAGRVKPEGSGTHRQSASASSARFS